MMAIAERNRRIKKVLGKFFGRENIRVKGGRGTAYGWVEIALRIKIPKEIDVVLEGSSILTEEYRKIRDKVISKIYELLREADLMKEIGVYYDDFNIKRSEMNITIIPSKEFGYDVKAIL